MFSPVHLEYFYIYIVNFRRMASGAFCDEEDVLEIWKFRSSWDSDNDPDVYLYVMNESEGEFHWKAICIWFT